MRIRTGIALVVLGAVLAALPGCQGGQVLPGEEAVSAGAWSAERGEDTPVEPQPADEPLTREETAQILEETMAEESAMGVWVAVIEGGEPGASSAWGWAVRDAQAMTVDTKVRVASLSKVAVGMCALAMEEEGLLDLEAPLSAYWGEAVRDPYAQTQPSAASLMSHSSAVKDFAITRGLPTLTKMLSKPSAWRGVEPGSPEAWYYSNFGICVLGTTLELASGQLLDDYLQTRFFQPMGVRASFYAGRLETEEVAALYGPTGVVQRTREQQTGQEIPTETGMGASYYPGGLTISAADLAKLVAILANDGEYQGETYLSPESVAAMETVQFAVSQEGTAPFDQCLILRRQDGLLGRNQLYYHTGSAYGVYSLLSYDPDTGDGVVVITSGAPWEVDDRGLYGLCARLSEKLYAAMEEHEI